MKIGLAQTKPLRGDIPTNISRHLKLINLAVDNGAELIIFPELSITGYEPTLAKELATTPDDSRFAVFQQASDANNLTIGIGAPLQKAEGLTISLLLFQPHRQREIYSKRHLHPDEEPFFVSGQNITGTIAQGQIALAICYELSVPRHAATAFRNGAEIYLASVAKTAEGVSRAAERLAQISRQYRMTTFMVNCLGACDGMRCSGNSAAWNPRGECLARLDEEHEGILVVDTSSGEAQTRTL